MRFLTAAIAMASGLIILLGYFYPLDALTQARILLTNWAIIIAAAAVFVGIVNMILVHMEKIRKREKNSMYGALLIAALVVTMIFGMVSPYLGLNDLFTKLTVEAVIVPVEGALMAILAVTLIYASIRLLRRRMDMMTVLFLIVAVISLIAVMPTPIGPVPGDMLLLQFLSMFSSGGARGLLIGIALGTLLTGLRVLFGIDRPYGGN